MRVLQACADFQTAPTELRSGKIVFKFMTKQKKLARLAV
jgi:hypothetical protein